MSQTILIREGDYGPLQYQVMEFDETTDDLLPVDVTNETITFSLYRQVQQSTGMFTAVNVASDQPCTILNASDGWIQLDTTVDHFATFGMYCVTIKRVGDTLGRTYPRYDEQWIRVLPLSAPPTEFTPVEE